MDITVEKFEPKRDYAVSVPASKSELNRALLLAALSPAPVTIVCSDLGEDAERMLACLCALGVPVERTREGLLVRGCGSLPRKSAELDVGSAGTAARFLPAVLAFAGGTYRFTCSEQMRRRPMGLLGVLEGAGVKIEYEGARGSFPFRMSSEGVRAPSLTIDTAESTQYASALLLAGSLRPPFTVRLTGPRTDGSYIDLTRTVLRGFGFGTQKDGERVTVLARETLPTGYEVEPDLSGACYFFAAALLCRARILVKGVKMTSAQGDVRFLRLLEARGLRLTQTAEGLLADGTAVASFEGFCEDFSDFSDQTLTAAALAPFAATPSRIRNVGHIRRQESDRLGAAVRNLTALGVPAETENGDLLISPAPVKRVRVESFGDHRVAMAFALVGLRCGTVIGGAECCAKTFPDYFGQLAELLR